MLSGRKKLPAGWYTYDVKDVTQKTSKQGDSENFWVDLVIAEGPEAGYKVRNCFNEQVPENIGEFMKHFGNTEALLGLEVLDGMRKAIGRKIGGYTKYNPETGWNDIEDWRVVA
jgi:hypothetical protein